ncbi:MAG: ROK family protein [Chloroflexota bacterium]
MKYYGGIEAGGTKFVCMVGRGPQDIRAETRFPTTASPAETVDRAVAFFKQQAVSLAAIGIGSFGPVDLDTTSPTFGYITNTAKPGWVNTNIAGMLQAELNLPVVIDTDVNVAAFGEYRWGAGQSLDPILYLTIGTGIGGGAICGGKPLHGLMHPEMGHVLIPHDHSSDPFPGVCPFHGDCFEGLASGPALSQRWGQPAETLPDDHPAWELETHYLALALTNLILSYSPRRIVLGGGVMQHERLFPLLRRKTQQFLKGYIRSPQLGEHIDRYIVPPALGNQAGVLGAIALAMDS